MNRSNISFILHKPQLSENIGACARAMKNFDFKKLIIINPKPIFPNDKILATSVGAKDVILQSKNFNSLEKAVSKIDIVIATSARFRNKNINYMIADKTIHLPSINQISKLMKGIDFELDEQLSYRQNNIYYFGG